MEITSFGFFSKLFKIFKIMNRSIIHIYLSVDFSDTLYKFGFSNSAPNGNHIFRILFKTFQNFLNYESFYIPFILVSIFQTPSTSLDSQIRPQIEMLSFVIFSKLFKIFKIMNRSLIRLS